MRKLERSGSGFSLVEVVLALGVAAISLIAIFGLLPVGLQTAHNAIEQSASGDIMSAVVADLKATPPTSPRGGSATSRQFSINIPSNPIGSAAAPTTLYFNDKGQLSSSPGTSRYRLTITFPANGTGAKTATFVDLRMTWPGVANPANAQGSAEVFIALDRN
jgi:uncharacterized protein (TIGR02598 family)